VKLQINQTITDKGAVPPRARGGDDEWELGLLKSILDEIKSGRVQLPSLPDVALRVREAVRDEQRNIADVTRLVQVDPALTARLIQVVNSPLYRGNKKIDNLHTAITRLGLEATRNLVMSFSLKSLFKPRAKALAERLQQTWRHSCRVGALSSVLARLSRGVDPDRAMLGGLVHDIGELPVLQFLEKHDHSPDGVTLEPLLQKLRGPLGSFVLKIWQFEADLAVIPRVVEDWSRESRGPVDSLDIVQVSHAHSLFGTPQAAQLPPLTELAAFTKLPISQLGPDASLELLEQSRQEISDVIQILQS